MGETDSDKKQFDALELLFVLCYKSNFFSLTGACQ